LSHATPARPLSPAANEIYDELTQAPIAGRPEAGSEHRLCVTRRRCSRAKTSPAGTAVVRLEALSCGGIYSEHDDREQDQLIAVGHFNS
jgi:hypothetical protein